VWQCAKSKDVAVCGSVWQCVAVRGARAWCCCSVYTAAVREGVLKLIVCIQELEVQLFFVMFFFGFSRVCACVWGFVHIHTFVACVLVCVCACVRVCGIAVR